MTLHFFSVSLPLKCQEANVWRLRRPNGTKDVAEISAPKAKRIATQVKNSKKEKASRGERKKERKIFLRRSWLRVNMGKIVIETSFRKLKKTRTRIGIREKNLSEKTGK